MGVVSCKYVNTGETVYALFYKLDGTVWQTTDNSWQAFVVANIANYDVAAAETPAGSYRYQALIDVDISTALTLKVEFYVQAGGAPAITDLLIATGQITIDAAENRTDLIHTGIVAVADNAVAANLTRIDGDANVDATLELTNLTIVNAGGQAIEIEGTTDAITVVATGGHGIGINALGGSAIDLTSDQNGVVISASQDGIEITANIGIDLNATGDGINILSSGGSGFYSRGNAGHGIAGITGGGGHGIAGVALALGSGALLQGFSTGDGLSITAGATGIGIDVDAAGNSGITINAGGNGSGIIVTGAGTGDGIGVVAGATGAGVNIDAAGGLGIDIDAVQGVEITSTAGSALKLISTGGPSLHISSFNAIGMQVDCGINSSAVRIIGGTTAGDGITITAALEGIDIDSTGDAINVTSTAGYGFTMSGLTGDIDADEIDAIASNVILVLADTTGLLQITQGD